MALKLMALKTWITAALCVGLLGCQHSPEAQTPEREVLLDGNKRPSFQKSRYTLPVILHVPKGSRLIDLENGGQSLLAAIRSKLYQRHFEDGTVTEFWVWLDASGAFASFDHNDYIFDLSIEEQRLEVLAKAYGANEEPPRPSQSE